MLISLTNMRPKVCLDILSLLFSRNSTSLESVPACYSISGVGTSSPNVAIVCLRISIPMGELVRCCVV